MQLGSVEGVVVMLVVLLPGGLGDALMRFVTKMPPPQDNWSQIIAAAAWSVSSLSLVELAYSAFRNNFGEFLIVPLTGGDVASGVGAVAGWRYAAYVGVAIVFPSLARWGVRQPFIEKLAGGRTMAEHSIDRLLRYAPPLPEAYGPATGGYVRILTDGGGPIEGWVQWASDSLEGEDAAYIVRDADSLGVTWVPLSSVRSLTYVDLQASGSP
ncbi:hypothetical protein BH23ACT6_BH23ACT6_27290 [soil metagenome]